MEKNSNLMPNETVIKKLGFSMGCGARERARIGSLVLASDHTLEWEI